MKDSRRILVVEDDVPLREVLVEQLTVDYGFIIIESATIREADGIITNEDARIDGIILDVGLPDGDGCEFCADLRRAGHKMPIIILTGLTAEEDVVRGLSSGANDYVVKPFWIGELAARLHAQLRGFDASEDAVFSIGPYVFHPSKRQMRDPIKRRRIQLTDKEASILKFLFRSGVSVTRESLLHEVWGYNSGVSAHTVETHIYRLRQKLEVDPNRPTMLITVQHGYQLWK